MVHMVTVRGSLTPCAGVLARGEERTVAVTDDLRMWVARGCVDVVDGSLDAPAAPVEFPGDGIPKVGIEVPLGETAELVSDDTGGPYEVLPEVDNPDSDAPLDPLPDYPVPTRNGSRGDWAEFIAARGLGVTEGKSRDELRDIWDQHVAAGGE
ncbi:hypothetical protein [Mycolicibacterium sp.]|uniref:hypothetical protein n=1 Tax=Mycolicibacterium sp. TaxID=2320850 RepID=UPI00355E9ADD